MKFPVQTWEGLNLLAKMSKLDFEQLLDILANARPTLSSSELVLGAENRKIAEALLSVYYSREVEELSIEEAVDELLEAAESFSPDLLELVFTAPDSLKDRLRKAVSLEGALQIAAKARDVLTENERVFVDSRIITEMRPVYGDDPQKKPDAAVILHTLKIVAYESFRHTEFFVTLDNRDLKKLRKDIDRAEKKTIGLKAAIEDTEVAYLEVEEEA